MTAHAVEGGRGRGGIDCYCCRMVMTVTIEVGTMALNTASTSATIDGSVTVAVDTNSTSTVGRVMTGGAGGMHRRNSVAGVTVDTQGGRCDCRCVTMGMGRKVGGVTL